MEARGLISYSAAASLAVCLLLRPLWSLLAARLDAGAWRTSTTRSETAYVGGHLLAGAMLGAAYFLSWGFAAVVSVPWWQRGLLFGLISAATLTLPLVVIAVSLRRESAWLYVMLLTEATVTATACGLTCSYYWANAAV